jgi:hypothetical protein
MVSELEKSRRNPQIKVLQKKIHRILHRGNRFSKSNIEYQQRIYSVHMNGKLIQRLKIHRQPWQSHKTKLIMFRIK